MGSGPSNHLTEAKPRRAQPSSEKACRDCRAILGIGFSSSRRKTGREHVKDASLRSVRNGISLHNDALMFIEPVLNAHFNANQIWCYGSGDAVTGTKCAFSFFSDNQPLHNFEALVPRYQQLAAVMDFGEGTSLAPLIKQSINEVRRSGLTFHVVIILTDGQLSQKYLYETKEAIADAAALPLYILLIGLGDGPWTVAERLTELTPKFADGRCHFVKFSDIANGPATSSEASDGASPLTVSTIVSDISAKFTSFADLKNRKITTEQQQIDRESFFDLPINAFNFQG